MRRATVGAQMSGAQLSGRNRLRAYYVIRTKHPPTDDRLLSRGLVPRQFRPAVVTYLFDGGLRDVREHDAVGQKLEQLVDAVVPRHVAVREVGQLGEGRVQDAVTGRRARVPQERHEVADGRPLVRAVRVQPVRQAADETPRQPRFHLGGVEPVAVHEGPERVEHHGRLREFRDRHRRCHLVVAVGLQRRDAAAEGPGHFAGVVDRSVRRRRQRAEHVRGEHFRDGRVHLRRII